MRPIYLVLFVNVAFVGVAYAVYEMGQLYAPEIMASDAVKPPMVLGVLGIAGWLVYWSVRMLKRRGTGDEAR
jgi:hypothetical protein